MEKKRVIYLDIFRYLTVTLAIVSHIVGHHYPMTEHASDIGAVTKSITRAASPALLILFGMMIEMVYVKRFRSSATETYVSLIHRSFLCYLAVIALATVTLIAGAIDLVRYAGAVILVSPVVNSDIFKLYTILLILTIPLLFVRQRFGAAGVITVAAVLWAFHWAVLKDLPALPFPFHYVGSLTLGIGHEFGPTVLHSFVLLAFGMAIANVLTASTFSKSWMLVAVSLVITSSGVIGYHLLDAGFLGVAKKIAYMEEWRGQHHPGYYAYGILVACVLLGISWLLSKVLPTGVTNIVSEVGGSTLMYFFLANLLLFLIPEFVPGGPLAASLLMIAYVVGFTGLALLWSRHGKRNRMVVTFNENVKSAVRWAVQRPLLRRQAV